MITRKVLAEMRRRMKRIAGNVSAMNDCAYNVLQQFGLELGVQEGDRFDTQIEIWDHKNGATHPTMSIEIATGKVS